jgi:hypothetical protein
VPTKILVVVNDETLQALDAIATRDNKPRAALIREGIELRLKQDGYTINTRLKQGNTEPAPKKKGEG